MESKHKYPSSLESKATCTITNNPPAYINAKLAILIGETKKLKNLIRKY